MIPCICLFDNLINTVFYSFILCIQKQVFIWSHSLKNFRWTMFSFPIKLLCFFCHSNIVYHVTLVQSQFLGYIVTRLTKKAWWNLMMPSTCKMIGYQALFSVFCCCFFSGALTKSSETTIFIFMAFTCVRDVILSYTS